MKITRAEPFELIGALRQQIEDLKYNDAAALDAVRRRSEMVARNIFGQFSKYVSDLAQIHFYPRFSVGAESLQYQMKCWEDGRAAYRNVLNTMEEELKLFGPEAIQESTTQVPRIAPAVRSAVMPAKPRFADATATVGLGQASSEVRVQKCPDVFVVHGHDEEMKQAVARALTVLGLKPIILHEHPNQGRTIIEKFSDYANVEFAIVLLSPDDEAHPRATPEEPPRTRARQNVVLELGYFLGKLGRSRVVSVFRQDPRFEMPSDYSGVIFVPYDREGRWRFDLLRELAAAGYMVDANALL